MLSPHSNPEALERARRDERRFSPSRRFGFVGLNHCHGSSVVTYCSCSFQCYIDTSMVSVNLSHSMMEEGSHGNRGMLPLSTSVILLIFPCSPWDGHPRLIKEE